MTQWAPKRPDEILRLKVCDPAMGSGSFLVGALRFLTDALTESFFYHGLLEQKGDRTIPRLADGKPFADFGEEPIPLPLDHPQLEERLRARLKRYVVERCIYGVDIDPLAVELARLALWVETMDRERTFGFLDHKLKCGNSLVGAWTDRVFDYPAAALEHCGDAGDKTHNGVHFPRLGYSNALKRARDEVLKPALSRAITSRTAGLAVFERDVKSEAVHAEATVRFEALHEIPIFDVARRKAAYDTLQGDENFQRLKTAYDAWCAVWFWQPDPVRREDGTFDWEVHNLPTAENYLAPTGATLAAVQRLAARHRFFHWELEFPDVFTPTRHGFDAILGNPPWEIQKPNSREFFSNIDPLYRSYGKQEALRKQREYFEPNAELERGWVDYNASYKALSNWAGKVAYPYGDAKFTDVGSRVSLARGARDSDTLHTLWAQQRESRAAGFADPGHPFRYQGSADLNTYKLFLEFGRALLDYEGRIGMIVPSGVYSDKGSTELRQLFLNESRWEWLFGFENREKVFDIDSRFKFGPVIVQKGGQTTAIRAAFMRHDLSDWENAEQHVIPYPRDRVEQFSPNTCAILELQSSRDLEILEKIYANSVLLGDDGPDGWGITYSREFDMTNDSKLFPPRPEWEAKGYAPDEYGHWLKGNWRPVTDFGFREDKSLLDPQYKHWSILDRPDAVVLSRDGTKAMSLDDLDDVALPLYEGRMIGQFDFSEKGWVSGKGRTAVWREIPWDEKVIEPQFLMGVSDFEGARDKDGNRKAAPGLKLGFMDVTSATNTRTFISSLVMNAPCGNKVPVLASADPLLLAGLLNSFAFDYIVRTRLIGITLNWYIVEEAATAALDAADFRLRPLVLALNGPSTRFASAWTATEGDGSWRSRWAVTAHERRRVRALVEVLAARAFGLSFDELGWILRDCDLPPDEISGGSGRRLPSKGFWRVDKSLPPEQRLSGLVIRAFKDLAADDVVLSDWSVPPNLAQHFGVRLAPWQSAVDAAESWAECRAHASLIERIAPSNPLSRHSSKNGSLSGQGALL